MSIRSPRSGHPCGQCEHRTLGIAITFGESSSANHAAMAAASSSSWSAQSTAKTGRRPRRPPAITVPSPAQAPRRPAPVGHRNVRPANGGRVGTQFDVDCAFCGGDLIGEVLEQPTSQDLELERIEDFVHGVSVEAAPLQSGTELASGTSRTEFGQAAVGEHLLQVGSEGLPALPGTLSALATRPSRPLNSLIHLVAVFSPTPGIPGRLSLLSPRSCEIRVAFGAVHTFLHGRRIHPRQFDTPRFGYSTVMSRSTSWKASYRR